MASLIFTTTSFAFADSSKLGYRVAEVMETANGVIPICIALKDLTGSAYSREEIYALTGYIWDFSGTLEQWWERHDEIATQKVTEILEPIFTECGLDINTVKYLPEDMAHLLTVEQINALTESEEVGLLNYKGQSGKTPRQRTIILDWTAEDALKTLQCAVGNLDDLYLDLNGNGKCTTEEALTVLQCAVGKRIAGVPQMGYKPAIDPL